MKPNGDLCRSWESLWRPLTLGLLIGISLSTPAVAEVAKVWANDGGDKVAREEIRARKNHPSVINRAWNGSKISVFGAKNEIVGFNVVLESGTTQSSTVSVELQKLDGPGGWSLVSAPASGDLLFNWTNRQIELFYIQYLQINGLSQFGYNTYDERHVPKRFRRPFTGAGFGSGGWSNRPDRNKYYPDIAVPIDLKKTFKIAANRSQSIWVDIFIPKAWGAGLYKGTLVVKQNGVVKFNVPVELTVRNFTLPDMPSAKTMVFYSPDNIDNRYRKDAATMTKIRDRHFMMAHRHRLSLIDAMMDGDKPAAEWLPRLNGTLFAKSKGYDGPGLNTGNNVYSIGTYGSWGWQNQGEAGMRQHLDAWANWFAANAPTTETFLYLIDESTNYSQIEQWAKWVKNNPGPGKNIRSFATMSLVDAAVKTPSLDYPCSTLTVGITSQWEAQVPKYTNDVRRKFCMYNASRPANGSFMIEDDGVSQRQLAWSQFKKEINRWFYWESTYYDNYQGGMGETNVFTNALTFGAYSYTDSVMGRTGWNYSNGEGVLFYPGTDALYTGSSYNINGPIASLRLKHWRQGNNDVDYLTMAKAKDPARVQAIVNRIVPKVLWEYGVDDMSDPTWVRTDISWSIDPNVWWDARKELADIIEGVASPMP